MRSSISIVFLLMAGPGCKSPEQPSATPYVGKTAQRLELEDFIGRLASAIELSGDEAANASNDPQVKRNVILWKMRAIPTARRCLELADDQAAFLSLWLFCARMEHSSQLPIVDELFAEGAHYVQAACTHLEQGARHIAPGYLTAEQITAAEESIDSHKDDNPLGVFDKKGKKGSGDPISSVIGDVVNKPVSMMLRPLGSLNMTSGLSDTAIAVERAAMSVDAIRTDLGYMPDMLRWQTTLLLHELERNDSISATVTSLEEVGRSSERLATVAEKLPGEVGSELDRFVEVLDQNQTGLQTTLEKTRENLNEVSTVLDKADTLLVAADKTSQSLSVAGGALEGLAREVTRLIETAQGPPDEESTGSEPTASAPDSTAAAAEKPPGKPFDINEYTRAAEELTESAQALDALVRDVTNLIEPASAEKGKEAMIGVVDALLLRAGAALTFLVALVVGGRWSWKRVGPDEAA